MTCFGYDNYRTVDAYGRVMKCCDVDDGYGNHLGVILWSDVEDIPSEVIAERGGVFVGVFLSAWAASVALSDAAKLKRSACGG